MGQEDAKPNTRMSIPVSAEKHRIPLTPLRTCVCVSRLRGLEKYTPTVNSGCLRAVGEQEGDFRFLLYRLLSSVNEFFNKCVTFLF